MEFGAIGRTRMLYDSIIKLVESGHTLKWIITAPAAPEYCIRESDFEVLATKFGVPFYEQNKVDSEFVRTFSANADICVSVNYTTVIPDCFIKKFEYGVLNAHAGDLPKYRGNAPLAWAILNEEDRIGLCIHYMVGGELDSGDIVAKEYLNIHGNSRIGELQEWVDNRVPALFKKAISNIGAGVLAEKQNQTKAHRCFPRIPEDSRINWKESNSKVVRLINASSEPYRGAYCSYKSQELVIWRAVVTSIEFDYSAVPGQLYIDQGRVYAVCGRGVVELLEVEYKGVRASAHLVLRSIRSRLS